MSITDAKPVGRINLITRIIHDYEGRDEQEWTERLGERLLTDAQRAERALMRKAARVLGYERADTADDTSIRLWLEAQGLTYCRETNTVGGQYDEGQISIDDPHGRWVNSVRVYYLCPHCLCSETVEPAREEADIAIALLRHVRCGLHSA